MAAEAVPRAVVVERVAEVGPVVLVIDEVGTAVVGAERRRDVIEAVVIEAVLIDGHIHETVGRPLSAKAGRSGGAAGGLGAVGGNEVGIGRGGCHGSEDVGSRQVGGTAGVVQGYGVECGGACRGALVVAGEEAVLKGERVAVAPALQAADVVLVAGDGAGIDAVAQGEVDGVVASEAVTHDAAAVPVVAYGGVDVGLHEAVLDKDGAGAGLAYQSGGVGGAGDGAGDVQVADGGVADEAEGRGALFPCVGDVHVERVFLTVEGAHEPMIIAARRLRDADVGAEFHGLAGEVATGL